MASMFNQRRSGRFPECSGNNVTALGLICRNVIPKARFYLSIYLFLFLNCPPLHITDSYLRGDPCPHPLNELAHSASWWAERDEHRPHRDALRVGENVETEALSTHTWIFSNVASPPPPPYKDETTMHQMFYIPG